LGTRLLKPGEESNCEHGGIYGYNQG